MGNGEWIEFLEGLILKYMATRYCKECGRKKVLFNRFCLFCFKKTNTKTGLIIGDTVSVKENIKIRKNKNGIKKFVYELLQGWFSSGDKKIKNGVYKTRIVNREENKYYEHVKNYENGKILRNCEEELKKH